MARNRGKMTFMEVPEAPMNEYHCLVALKYKVGATGQILLV
jgi:hypothetical protein